MLFSTFHNTSALIVLIRDFAMKNNLIFRVIPNLVPALTFSFIHDEREEHTPDFPIIQPYFLIIHPIILNFKS